MKKTLVVLVGLAALLLVAVAYPSGQNLTIRSVAGGDQYCLDASLDHRAAEGDPVYLFKCHGRENQRWVVTHDQNGQSAIIGLDGYCLDVRGAHSKADGTPVQLWSCHYGSNQRFYVAQGGAIKEVTSGKCLMPLGEADRAPVVIDTRLNTPQEFWHFVP